MENYLNQYLNYLKSLNYEGFTLNSEYWIIVLISHLSWWTLLALSLKLNIKHEKKKLYYDTKTRIVSILHASLIFWLCLYDVVFFQSDKCGSDNYFFQNFILLISFSYFAYDIIACIWLDCSDNEMIYHHVSVMLAYYCSLAFNNSASEMMRALIVAEVTNPIMHLRVIIKNVGLKDTKIYIILDYVYMVMYVIARMIYGTQVIIFTVFCRNNVFFVKLGGAFVYLQSIIFSRRMFRIAMQRFREKLERKSKGVSLHWFSHNKKIEELNYYKKSLSRKAEYVP